MASKHRDEDSQKLVADLQALLDGIAHLADPEIGPIRERIEAGIAATRTAIDETALRVRREAAKAIRSGDQYVRDRPWQTAGLAAGLGFLVGVLITSRWTRSAD